MKQAYNSMKRVKKKMVTKSLLSVAQEKYLIFTFLSGMACILHGSNNVSLGAYLNDNA